MSDEKKPTPMFIEPGSDEITEAQMRYIEKQWSKMPRFAILDEEKNVVPVDDVLVWARWTAENRKKMRRDEHFKAADIVAQKRIWPRTQVSTIFIGLNHAFPTPDGRPPKPLWFETMVFGGVFHGCQYRYSTYQEALEGHQQTVRWLTSWRYFHHRMWARVKKLWEFLCEAV